MAGKGPTLADGAKHDCVKARCHDVDGHVRYPASPVHMKWLDVTRNERSARVTDSIDRTLSEKTVAVALLALSAKEVEALEKIAAATSGVKNYAVLIRRLITREAKALG